MECSSNGPGVSIEAKVNARINGGDSFTCGIGAGGTVTILCIVKNCLRPASADCASLMTCPAAGEFCLILCNTWSGDFVESMIPRGLHEERLHAAHFVLADLEQVLNRFIDHLVIQKFLLEILHADGEIAL